MARRYAAAQRQQIYWAPTCSDDLVAEGHLARFVVEVVARLRTAVLHTRLPGACPGRPPFDPIMMFSVILYAYASGIYSSRRMEAACQTDLAFRYITGGLTPDHATFARFIVDHQGAMHSLFVDGLRLLVAAELIDLEIVAIDGTKLAGNASLQANHPKAWIEEKVNTLMAATVASEVTEGTGPVLASVAQIRGAKARQNRLEQAFARIEAEDATEAAVLDATEQAAMAEAAEGRQVKGRKPTDPRERVIRARADHAAAQANEAAYMEERAALEQVWAAKGRRPTRPPTDRLALRTAATAQALAEAERVASANPAPVRMANVTDVDSRIMHTRTGSLQGYNAQAAVTASGVIIAQAVTQETNDVHQLEPMLNQVTANLNTTALAPEFGTVLSDAGYWSVYNATLPVAGELLIATQKSSKQRKAAQELGVTTGPPPEGATPQEAMEHRLRTKEGAEAYAKRSSSVEPVFGQFKQDRGFTRFRRRGLEPVRAELSLVALAHNVLKLFTHSEGQLTLA